MAPSRCVHPPPGRSPPPVRAVGRGAARRSIARVKLLLTSGGLRNESIRDGLRRLVDRSFTDAKLVLVMTAATAQGGNHDWLVEDINRVYGLGWGRFNILEINGLPRQVVLRRLADADVIYVEGGNAYHLAHSILRANLADELLRLLQDRVYVGASAGSMLFTRRLTDRLTALYGVDDELYQLNERRPVSPFGLFDWFVQLRVSGGRLPRHVTQRPAEGPVTATRTGRVYETSRHRAGRRRLSAPLLCRWRFTCETARRRPLAPLRRGRLAGSYEELVAAR